MLSSENKEFVLKMLKLLNDLDFFETAHKLEAESGLYFNLSYFEKLVTNGEFEEVEKYLSGFMKVEDNNHSKKMFFEIWKQKHNEALDRDAISARPKLWTLLCESISKNSLFKDKLQCPVPGTQTRTGHSTLSWHGQQSYNHPGLPSSFTDPTAGLMPPWVGGIPDFHGYRPFYNQAPSVGRSHAMNSGAGPSSVPHNLASVRSSHVINPDVDPSSAPHKAPSAHPSQVMYVGADPSSVPHRAPYVRPSQVMYAGVAPSSVLNTAPSVHPSHLMNVGAAPSSVLNTAASVHPSQLMNVGAAPSSALHTAASVHRSQLMNVGAAPSSVLHTSASVHPSQLINAGADPSSVPHKAASVGPSRVNNLGAHSNAESTVKRPRTAAHNPAIDHQTVGSALVLKRSGHFGCLTEINDPSQLRALRLTNMVALGIMRLLYPNSGDALLAMTSTGMHMLWKRQSNDSNVTGKATSGTALQLWMLDSKVRMINDTIYGYAVDPCLAISKIDDDDCVISSSGGKISIFNMKTSETMKTIMLPPPVATALAIHSADSDVLAIGMDDSTIKLYNFKVDQVILTLRGHKKKVTGLTFSNHASVLVSSGADSQLCAWDVAKGELRASKFLQIPPGRVLNPNAQTRVQFRHDQAHVLVVHETQVAIYDVNKLECKKQWVPGESSRGIIDATCSCDGESVFVSLDDGSVFVLIGSTLTLRCKINQTAYLPPEIRNKTYVVSLAAHPSEPNQFAIGLKNGWVYVLKPLESEAKWGTLPPS
ncbi:hypothetical protein vseg_012987 [Gypsophila vaccaria]